MSSVWIGLIVAAAGAFKKEELAAKLEAAFKQWPAVAEPA